jgi:hypothetical protein
MRDLKVTECQDYTLEMSLGLVASMYCGGCSMREERIAGTYCNPGIAVGTWLERPCYFSNSGKYLCWTFCASDLLLRVGITLGSHWPNDSITLSLLG